MAISTPQRPAKSAAPRKPRATKLSRVAHKFGGTSMATAERIAHVAKLLRKRPEPEQIVVVSAMAGVTDALIRLTNRAAARSPDWRDDWHALRQRHRETARELLGGTSDEYCAWLDGQFADLVDLLHALSLLGSPSAEAVALISGLGEVFSARLLAAHFAKCGDPAALLDARDVLVVRHEEIGVTVDWDATQDRFAQWRTEHPDARCVVTGFVARDVEGRATTLGRNGSDYSGAIFGALFEAEEIQVWTDVDGVLSADPRVVPEAVLVPSLSYHEACELAYFGAKVIHPQTMAPAIARGIPIRIRNTFRPEHEGSVIAATNTGSRAPVTGITTIDALAIVNVEGAGMIGVPGTAERVFAALHRAGISVVMISQGSSEHSICCVLSERHAIRAVATLEDAFSRELARGQIQSVSATPGVSVLAVVGDGMAGTPGTAARLFEALARSRINVRAIAQGASERNISVAIGASDSPRALRAVHAAFYLSPQTISLGLVGPGQVGHALIAQLAAQCDRLRAVSNLDIRLRGICDSRRMLLDDAGIPLDEWRLRWREAGEELDMERFAAHVHAPHLPHAVIADCSASATVANEYAGWLGAGIHVVTPNKQAGAGPLERMSAIRTARAATGARWRYEATVGAGLPIIQTLRDLVDTGDEVIAIEGILSGTLAWLFNKFDGSTAFSSLVLDARRNGYTEPDPRDDLSGLDVARKLVILAREMGREIALDEVDVESLVPDELVTDTREQFLRRVPLLDAPMQLRLAAARSKGMVLRYVARLEAGKRPRVGLAELPTDHPFAHIRLTDNVVQFTTGRYRDNPLVVQGPGAGPDVTAAGVFADLLRVAQSLGAAV
ncbi:MAG TPA: bifunctional aspartate kinase/homoserine dehydrogenase I [Xanthomonadales bacterium]|nr:bifunctional aspartate kinase/homoserine dehydrogenase I [Xanthomonadales bacterium]